MPTLEACPVELKETIEHSPHRHSQIEMLKQTRETRCPCKTNNSDENLIPDTFVTTKVFKTKSSAKGAEAHNLFFGEYYE